MQLCNGCSSAAPDRRGQHAAVTRPYRSFPHILSILWGFGTFTDAAVSSRGEVGDGFLGWRKANLPHATYTSQNGTASTASHKLTMPDAENIPDCVWTGLCSLFRSSSHWTRANTYAKRAWSGQETKSEGRPVHKSSRLHHHCLSSRRVPLIYSPKREGLAQTGLDVVSLSRPVADLYRSRSRRSDNFSYGCVF